MYKIFFILIISVLISGCNTSPDKKQTYSGLLEISSATKGGVGHDSCLGSSFYKLKLSSGKEIRLDPYPFLIKNNISRLEFDKLLGRNIKIKGQRVKQLSLYNEKNENEFEMQREVSPEDAISINCDHIEITEFKVIEQ